MTTPAGNRPRSWGERFRETAFATEVLPQLAATLCDYGRLMRMDRPIGTFLLLWPALWALWLASDGHPQPRVFIVFALGVFLMRSAGCVINDFADRKIDPHVRRTRERPLAQGRVEPKEAIMLFVALSLIALGLVMTLDRLTQQLALIGAVLRYSEEGTYDFASSFHIPTYLFLSLVVAMFLGLTNSVDDIIRDRPVLQRERNLNVRLGWYILAKVLTLSLFALVQCVFFILIANWILEVRGMFWIFLAAMVLTAVSGIAIGLLISSLVSESKTAVNIIPVVLIPQIILGGALIKYEEMNQNLDFVYSVSRWFSENPEAGQPRSDLQVPLICEFMPMRWSYEAIVFAQAKLNPLTSRQEKIQAQINKLARSPNLTVPEEERLEDLKELLAMVSGLQGADTAAVERELRGIDRVLDGEPLPEVSAGSAPRGVSAERLFVNQKTADLVNKAEMEQSDYRETRFLNVFFGPEKRYFGLGGSVLVFNAWVLILSSLAMFQALYFVLRQQLKSQQL